MKQAALIVLLSLVGASAGYVYKMLHGDVVPVKPRVRVAEETDWDDYTWPTNASTVRTSCFAEFRANHFHAGIDISTNMRTGYNVFASREGSLHSITFEAGGYGWYLVLRHKDGYYTCYAHLLGFPEKILKAYHAKLIQSGHSFGAVEWRDGEVPVKKGETVAFSGNSGIGPPHLHFEVRDRDFNPVNPGLSKHLRPLDTIPPEPLELCFMPLDQTSTVNGKYESATYRIVRKNGGYTITGTPVLSGRVGLLLKAFDRAQGAQDSPTPYSIAVDVDGKRYFLSQFDRIQNELGWHIRIDRDHAMMQKLKGEFRKLFREDGNILSVYDPMTPDGGVFSAALLSPGNRSVSIVAKDVSGNAAKIGFGVTLAQPLSTECVMHGDSVIVRIANPASVSAVRVYAGASSASPAHEWKGGEVKERLACVLAGAHARIVAFDKGGTASPAVYFNDAAKAGTFSVTRSLAYDEAVFSLVTKSAFDAAPSVLLPEGAKLKAVVLAQSPSQYRVVIKALEGFKGPASISIRGHVGGNDATWKGELDGTLVSAESGGSVGSPDGRMTASFKKAGVTRSMLCWITEANGGRKGYQLQPENVPLSGSVTVAIRPESTATKGLYVTAMHPGTFFRFSKDVRSDGAVAGTFLRMPAFYALADDTDGPEIQAGGTGKTMRFRITDAGSGLMKESICLMVDGNIVPLEYSEGQRMFFIPRDAASAARGKRIRITAADMLGNRSEKNIVVP